MAAIANTAFEARITNNEFNELVNIAGLYRDGSDKEDICAAGFLCTRKERIPCEGYGEVLNENSWYMTDALATDNASKSIYACNTYDVQMLQSASGNIYAIGTETLGLAAPAGRMTTFTKIVFDGDHVYRFGIGNVNGEIGTNTFFTIADGLLVPAAAAPATNGAVYFELRGTGTFTVGASDGFGYVDVAAARVVA